MKKKNCEWIKWSLRNKVSVWKLTKQNMIDENIWLDEENFTKRSHKVMWEQRNGFTNDSEHWHFGLLKTMNRPNNDKGSY